VFKLLEKGADVEVTWRGLSAAEHAALGLHVEILLALILKGARRPPLLHTRRHSLGPSVWWTWFSNYAPLNGSALFDPLMSSLQGMGIRSGVARLFRNIPFRLGLEPPSQHAVGDGASSAALQTLLDVPDMSLASASALNNAMQTNAASEVAMASLTEWDWIQAGSVGGRRVTVESGVGTVYESAGTWFLGGAGGGRAPAASGMPPPLITPAAPLAPDTDLPSGDKLNDDHGAQAQDALLLDGVCHSRVQLYVRAMCINFILSATHEAELEESATTGHKLEQQGKGQRQQQEQGQGQGQAKEASGTGRL